MANNDVQLTKSGYTAVIEIVKTETVVIPATTRNNAYTPETKNRENREVARIVIRADSIESLVTKAGAHLSLVED